ncbi:MAG: 50S ribosomal protein L10 [Deltaproteobacteria bacterium]|nr:50S ribosomal protein L10 [Deltaproteobacteria bacterium]
MKRWHELFGNVEGAVFTGVSSLTVAESTALRRRFKEAKVSYEVVRNTLARIALKETPLDIAVDLLDGPTAIAWSQDDPAAPARVAMAYSKEVDRFQIRGGFAGGQKLDAEGVKELATMPSFNDLRAMLLGTIDAVAAKLLAQINAPAQQLVGVCQARKEDLEQKEKKAA